METLELVVYILIAVIAGGLLLKLFMDINYPEVAADVDKEVQTEEKFQFRISKEEFFVDLVRYWEDCGLGTIDKSYAVYVKDEGNITRGEIVRKIIKHNKADVLREQDLNTMDIKIPTIIQIRCINQSMYLKGGE